MAMNNLSSSDGLYQGVDGDMIVMTMASSSMKAVDRRAIEGSIPMTKRADGAYVLDSSKKLTAVRHAMSTG